MKRYTNDWFGYGKHNFESLTHLFSGRKVSCLEIGSFEGRASNWIVENWCTHPESSLTCLDPFTGNVEHSSQEKDGLYERFISNTSDNRDKISVVRDFSTYGLPKLLQEGRKFDFIYVDGDHHNLSVILDAVYSDRLLEVGGIIGFDDYKWGSKLTDYERPEKAVDYFFEIMGDRYEILIKDRQVFARKTR